MKKLLGFLLVLLLFLVSCSSPEIEEKLKPAAKAGDTDYSNPYNWLKCDYDNPDKKDTDVDVIYFYATNAIDPYYDDGSVQIDDAMKDSVMANFVGGGDVFDEGTRLYMPCYRQIAFTSALQNEKHSDFLNQIKASLAAKDVYAALDYYFENYNEGRPFILAGYSQGAACTQIILEEYFGKEKNRELLNQMVATYSIGYGVDKSLIENNDYLKFATGAADTGVIVSWNTEGLGEKEYSILLADNPSDTLVINPINWKTDSTPARAEDSKGYYDSEKGIVYEGKYNLCYNPERGSLICDNNTDYYPDIDGKPTFGGKSLHSYEISQVYVDLRQNIRERIDAFEMDEKLKPAAKAGDTDYSDPYNWLKCDYANPDKKDTDVDVIYFYPTNAINPYYDDGSARIDDAMKDTVMAIFVGSGDVFDEGTRLYMPCYRQIALTIALQNEKHSDFMNQIKASLAAKDIYAALDYYFENYNEGRPFILAGYSQGAACTQIILEEYFGKAKNRELLNQMVATYSIGYGVDKCLIENNDYLKFATGPADTGVIVSWNTEGPGEKEYSILLADNPSDTLVINPVNWKTDSTPARAEDSKGYYDSEKGIVYEGKYNLCYDPERGSLICDNNTHYFPDIDGKPTFGGKSLHSYDISQVYVDVKQNIHDRIAAFLAK